MDGWVHIFFSRTNLPQRSNYSLRDTNIMLLLAAGIPLKTVSDRAGHAQTSTTANFYSHAIRTPDDGTPTRDCHGKISATYPSEM
jgi:integrase